jgi:hypothetical protein
MNKLEAGRVARRYVGVIALVPLAISLLVWEWNFDWRAHRAQAVVVETGVYGGVGWTAYGRMSGKTIADVNLVVDGEVRQATLRAWYVRFKPGQRVNVLFRAGDASDLALDSFWQLHWPSTLAILVLLGALVVETRKHVVWRSQQPHILLRD